MNGKIAVDYAGRIEVAAGDNPRDLYDHQNKACHSLDGQMSGSDSQPFAGLLVIPTGGGKTLTAVHWLLRNYVDQGKKVLWVAHRHELLEQAQEAFYLNAYSNLLRNRKAFNYRIISGIHDKPKNIEPSDDVVIASKDSLNSPEATRYLSNWIRLSNGEIFLVIDEAHHAIAKTYRKLIDILKGQANVFRMLGLTATPFRTAQNEQGLLKRLFVNDIVYKVDLRTLIHRGILAEPVFEESQTGFDMVEVLSDEDFKKIQRFDIENIGAETARTIAENRGRNNRIVNHYLENQARYGQTLVFALNVDNAIALNKLFRDKGIASDYVVSGVLDAGTRVTLSPKENKDKIEKFRKGELKVLINVNILTEGTDLPKVQTIFLTRPTISTILMTQMIGRGLRGERAGGTKQVYIVSFIDNWKDKIAWVNPEKLFIEQNTDFTDASPETRESVIRLVSIEKIEEFTRLMDQSIDTTGLENLDFIQRIPVGLYAFSILQKPAGGQEESEKNCEILVYDNIQQAYFDFVQDLPLIFQLPGIVGKETLDEAELKSLSRQVEDEYFYGCEKLPGYRLEDLKDLLRYYAMYEVRPQFVEFKDRPLFDVAKVAAEVYQRGVGGEAMRGYLDDIWQNDKIAWQAFFGYDRRYFVSEVTLAYRKLLFPDDFRTTATAPRDTKELRDFERLSLSELREKAPEYWRELSDKVFEKARDADGNYTSAQSGFKSKHKIHFQIDHIVPFSLGGPTRLDNLQLLTRWENAAKGNKVGPFQALPPEILSAEGDEVESLTATLPGEDSQPLAWPAEDKRLLFAITRQGLLRVIPYAALSSGSDILRQERDTVTYLLIAGPTDTVLFFTDQGKVFTRKISILSRGELVGPGVPVTEVINLAPKEKVVAVLSVPGFDPDEDLVMLTRRGRVKRISLVEFEAVRPSGLAAISAEVSPDLGWVRRIRSGQQLITVSRSGQALRFAADELRPMGRTAAGVTAMRLDGQDQIADVGVIDPDSDDLVVVTEQGFAKRTCLSEYPLQRRAGTGVRTLSNDSDRTGVIVAAQPVSIHSDLIVLSRNGILYRVSVKDISQQGRATQGKRLMDLNKQDTIVEAIVLKALS